MPGQVVKVQRYEKFDWVEQLYLPAIFIGLAITTRHFVSNLWGYIIGQKRTFVVNYPEERVDYADAFRGHPVLVALESGRPKCVACGLCEFACPTDCITIVPGEIDDPIERWPAQFDIDMSRCMFCGLCEESCPEEAIVMSRDVELATLTREEMLFHKEDLLRDPATLERRLTHIRRDYVRS